MPAAARLTPLSSTFKAVAWLLRAGIFRLCVTGLDHVAPESMLTRTSPGDPFWSGMVRHTIVLAFSTVADRLVIPL